MQMPPESIRDRIAAAIADGEFPPGTPLIANTLALRFGVSRSPIREALRALEGDGLVVYRPRRGHFVATLAPSDIEDIFYLREALEIAAVRLAYTRIPGEELDALEERLEGLSPESSAREEFLEVDHALHDLIARHSGNPRLRNALLQLSAQIEVTRRTSTSQHSRLADNLAEHKEIVTALRLADLPLIEARLKVHLQAGKASTLDVCRSMLFNQTTAARRGLGSATSKDSGHA